MDFLKGTTHWCECIDARIVDGKIVYTPFSGSRGYIGPGNNPSHEEILEREKKSGEVLCAVVYSNEEGPKDYFVISKSENRTNKIRPEFLQQKLEIEKRNEEKLDKFNKEEAKIIEIMNETADKISFFVGLTGEQVYDSVIGDGEYPIRKDRQAEFEPEIIPEEFYERMVTLKILFPWNSSEAEFIRENFKQQAFLHVF